MEGHPSIYSSTVKGIKGKETHKGPFVLPLHTWSWGRMESRKQVAVEFDEINEFLISNKFLHLGICIYGVKNQEKVVSSLALLYSPGHGLDQVTFGLSCEKNRPSSQFAGWVG